jgi:hypothetical protein
VGMSRPENDGLALSFRHRDNRSPLDKTALA